MGWHLQNCHPAQTTESLAFTQCPYYFNEKIEVTAWKWLVNPCNFFSINIRIFLQSQSRISPSRYSGKACVWFSPFSLGWDLLPPIISVCPLSSTLSPLLTLFLCLLDSVDFHPETKQKQTDPSLPHCLCIPSLPFLIHLNSEAAGFIHFPLPPRVTQSLALGHLISNPV